MVYFSADCGGLTSIESIWASSGNSITLSTLVADSFPTLAITMLKAVRPCDCRWTGGNNLQVMRGTRLEMRFTTNVTIKVIAPPIISSKISLNIECHSNSFSDDPLLPSVHFVEND